MKKYFIAITIYALICFLYVLTFIFYNSSTPELVLNGEEISKFFYDFSVASIVSYVFYVIVTYLPNIKDKKNVYSYIDKRKDELIQQFHSLLEDLIHDSCTNTQNAIAIILFEERNLEVNNLSEQDFIDISKVISPVKSSPRFTFGVNGQPIPILWKDLLLQNTNTILTIIRDILALAPYLYSDHIKMLSDLQVAEYVRTVPNIDQISSIDPTNIEILGKSLYNYSILIQNLDKKWDKVK